MMNPHPIGRPLVYRAEAHVSFTAARALSDSLAERYGVGVVIDDGGTVHTSRLTARMIGTSTAVGAHCSGVNPWSD